MRENHKPGFCSNKLVDLAGEQRDFSKGGGVKISKLKIPFFDFENLFHFLFTINFFSQAGKASLLGRYMLLNW